MCQDLMMINQGGGISATVSCHISSPDQDYYFLPLPCKKDLFECVVTH